MAEAGETDCYKYKSHIREVASQMRGHVTGYWLLVNPDRLENQGNLIWHEPFKISAYSQFVNPDNT